VVIRSAEITSLNAVFHAAETTSLNVVFRSAEITSRARNFAEQDTTLPPAPQNATIRRR
jgi:hypothetical protein